MDILCIWIFSFRHTSSSTDRHTKHEDAFGESDEAADTEDEQRQDQVNLSDNSQKRIAEKIAEKIYLSHEARLKETQWTHFEMYWIGPKFKILGWYIKATL